MPTNYADALRKKPPPPQQRLDRKEQESGAKRPRQNEQQQHEQEWPTPSDTKQRVNAPPPAARASAWGKPGAAKATKKPPSSILKRPTTEPPAAAAPTVVKPPPSKKSKKPRPSKNMSLGDVIPKRVVSSKRSKISITNDNDPRPPEPKQQEPQPMEMSSQEEFPSLSSSVASKPRATSLPAHAGWGKAKAPAPKKEKQTKKTVSKQAPPKKPPAAAAATAKKKSSLLDFGAKPRTDEDRGEHDLIRLLQDQKGGSATTITKKGRQRIAPRKKKFTTLKKKVLQERLEAWRKLHPPEETESKATTTSVVAPAVTTDESTCTVCLHNFAESDEVEEDDEYEEIVDNIKEMATKVGPIRDAFVYRQSRGSPACPAFVWFKTPTSAAAACACWNGLVVGGQSLEPKFLHPKMEGTSSGDSVDTEAWRTQVLAAYSSEKDGAMDNGTSNATTSIILRNVLSKDDFEDQEHLEESLSYIRFLVEKHGTVVDFEAKQDGSGGFVVVTYKGDVSIAKEAVTKLDGLLIGGAAISASLSDETVASSSEFVVELKNALTEDDLEDEDCLKESLSDIEALAKKHGSLSERDPIKIAGKSVLISFVGDLSAAKASAEKLDGTVLGGNILQASVVLPPGLSQSSNETSGWVLLQNIFTEDDVTDEECMEESIEDVRELGSRYGKVLNVMFDPDDLTRVVKIEFDGGSEVAAFAASKFNNMVLGGQTIAAIALASGSEDQGAVTAEPAPVTKEAAKPPVDNTPKPLYSGDKLIPERFAECKRVPKVSTSTGPRDYASLSKPNEEMLTLLIEMLGELMRLQRRAIEDKNAKARRRIVMGLREVARGIRAHKVKMVVMANNLDQYGAIDEKLQEILDLARQEDVPVIFQLNKRKLGKAVGKSIKVSVVGIQSADGAHQQFKKLVALAGKN